MSDAFSVISWSSMSSAPVMSDAEGSSSAALFSITACRAVTLPTGMLKPNLRSLFYPIYPLTFQLIAASLQSLRAF